MYETQTELIIERHAHRLDYEAARRSFRWEAARGELDGLPGGGLNIAHEAVDRHAAADGSRLALRWLQPGGGRWDLDYAELLGLTSRFANALAQLGVRPGARVFVLLGAVPELHVAALGALRHRAVVCALPPELAEEAIRDRLLAGGADVLVCGDSEHRRAVAEHRAALPSLRHVLLVEDGGLRALARPEGGTGPADTAAPEQGATTDLPNLLRRLPATHTIPPTNPDEPAVLHFSPGTSGRPEGSLHAHEAVVAYDATARFALDLRPDDLFWCSREAATATGLAYGVIAPRVRGAGQLLARCPDHDACLRMVRQEGVTVWTSTPSAIRALRQGRAQMEHPNSLRLLTSVGAPLDPATVRWSSAALGCLVHDQWWQSEAGGLLLANFVGTPVRPGSMGRPLPGIEAAVVEVHGDQVRQLPAGREGQLAVRLGWPSLARATVRDPDALARRCIDGWYLTGDLARRDEAGYYWFVGRAEDVIEAAGHLIGPVEVEAALLEHDLVVEAAAVAVPDSIAGAAFHAYISLRPGQSWDEALQRDIGSHVVHRLGPALAPRVIEPVERLPRTVCGRVMRHKLRTRSRS